VESVLEPREYAGIQHLFKGHVFGACDDVNAFFHMFVAVRS